MAVYTRNQMVEVLTALWDMQQSPDCWCDAGTNSPMHSPACAYARDVARKYKALAYPEPYLSLEGFPIWRPRVKHVFEWDNNREVWLVDQREFRIAIHDWTIWFTPWGRWAEWRKSDPWWIRGVSFNVKNFILGRTRYTNEQIGDPIKVFIPMPEGHYRATFTPERRTWKRPRWFSKVYEAWDIQIPKGIPFAGKGENSWDCGDDGLFGMSAEGTIEQAVEKVRATVLNYRKRYGQPSEAAIKKAMS